MKSTKEIKQNASNLEKQIKENIQSFLLSNEVQDLNINVFISHTTFSDCKAIPTDVRVNVFIKL